MQSQNVTLERGLRARDGRSYRVGAARRGHVIEDRREVIPTIGFRLPRVILRNRISRQLTEFVNTDLVERNPDYVQTGNQPGFRQVVEAWQQLALRKVTGSAEQHYHLRLLRPGARVHFHHPTSIAAKRYPRVSNA